MFLDKVSEVYGSTQSGVVGLEGIVLVSQKQCLGTEDLP
jgi:hypothetical protein